MSEDDERVRDLSTIASLYNSVRNKMQTCKHTAFNFEVAAFNVEVVSTLNLKNGELSYAILTRGRELK